MYNISKGNWKCLTNGDSKCLAKLNQKGENTSSLANIFSTFMLVVHYCICATERNRRLKKSYDILKHFEAWLFERERWTYWSRSSVSLRRETKHFIFNEHCSYGGVQSLCFENVSRTRSDFRTSEQSLLLRARDWRIFSLIDLMLKYKWMQYMTTE